MMVEAPRVGVPDTADIDGKVSRFDPCRIARPYNFHLRKQDLQRCEGVIAVKQGRHP
jgi:hypothetical protein